VQDRPTDTAVLLMQPHSTAAAEQHNPQPLKAYRHPHTHSHTHINTTDELSPLDDTTEDSAAPLQEGICCSFEPAHDVPLHLTHQQVHSAVNLHYRKLCGVAFELHEQPTK